jgi:hypothetical protein
MASLAEKRKADAEERSVEPQARPEELRLLEALLFASTEPLDQATPITLRAASTWFGSPTNGRSVPQAICRG